MRLRLPLICLLLVALLATLSAPLAAQDADYTAIVPVPDTTAPQRDHAFTVALTQVLSRVAGRDLSAQPGYADALGRASSLVQQYQYQRADSGGGFLLQVSFDRAAVRSLVDRLGASTWAGSRPPVLLLVRNAGGAVQGASQLVALTQTAGARGVAFTYPAAGNAPDAAQLAAGNEQALAAVARRYHTGLVLIGQLTAGQADWTLVAAGSAEHWQTRGGHDAELADAGNDLVNRLMQQFGSGPTGASGSGTLWVGGLASAQDFARLLAMLRQNSLVTSVVPEQAHGSGVLLQISARVPVASVADELVAEGHLLPAANSQPGADASARWLQ